MDERKKAKFQWKKTPSLRRAVPVPTLPCGPAKCPKSLCATTTFFFPLSTMTLICLGNQELTHRKWDTCNLQPGAIISFSWPSWSNMVLAVSPVFLVSLATTNGPPSNHIMMKTLSLQVGRTCSHQYSNSSAKTHGSRHNPMPIETLPPEKASLASGFTPAQSADARDPFFCFLHVAFRFCFFYLPWRLLSDCFFFYLSTCAACRETASQLACHHGMKCMQMVLHSLSVQKAKKGILLSIQ